MVAIGNLSQIKRRNIIKFGKRLTRVIDRILASQSLIGDQPVFDSKQFEWV